MNAWRSIVRSVNNEHEDHAPSARTRGRTPTSGEGGLQQAGTPLTTPLDGVSLSLELYLFDSLSERAYEVLVRVRKYSNPFLVLNFK